VIVSQKVQQSMQGQNLQLDRGAVSVPPGLPPGDAPRYHYVPEVLITMPTLGSWERQHVGRVVLPAVLPIQGSHPRVRHERYRDVPRSSAWGDTREPAREPGGTRRAPQPVDDGDSNHFPELYCS
jgi:hypothetical protein